MKFLLSAGAIFATLPFLGVAAKGQLPVVDGVRGGVPSDATVKAHTKLADLAPTTLAPQAGTLRVTENSGVCETTKGVYQASGYGDLTANQSIFFWFFAARENPDTAPLAIWTNGGPGSSSMIGLFQEHGPCRITNDSKSVTLNPYSWNAKANMLYIDQPVGVGFSHGTSSVGTSQQAAADVWKFLQLFFADSRFSKYVKNEFAIWTESYGGHYGPIFAAHFLDMNKAIANGTATGVPVNLKYLGVGNGLTDGLSQYPGYISYAASNPYHALVSSSVLSQANASWTSSNGCKAKITACNNGGSNSVCSSAQSYCNSNILSPLSGVYDVYDVRARDPDPYPPALDTYLGSSSFKTKIGAESSWQETNYNIYSNFAATGDWMRSARPALESVIDAGVRTLLFDGDADYICNYAGVELLLGALQTRVGTRLAGQPWTSWSVAGVTTGQYKSAGTFSYVRIYGAGHEVPAYKYGSLATGQAALTMFTQIMNNQSISST